MLKPIILGFCWGVAINLSTLIVAVSFNRFAATVILLVLTALAIADLLKSAKEM